MAWTGYNTSDGLAAIVQPASFWSTTSKPHTLAQIEEINKGIYLQINAFLRGKGIDITKLTEDDRDTLGLINSLWAAAIISPARFESVNKDGSKAGDNWDRRYKDMLENFASAKAQLSEDATGEKFTSTGIGLSYSRIKCQNPKFSVNDEW